MYARAPHSNVLLRLMDHAPAEEEEDATVRRSATDVNMRFKGTWPRELDG
jgi:hypothetical protein